MGPKPVVIRIDGWGQKGPAIDGANNLKGGGGADNLRSMSKMGVLVSRSSGSQSFRCPALARVSGVLRWPEFQVSCVGVGVYHSRPEKCILQNPFLHRIST